MPLCGEDSTIKVALIYWEVVMWSVLALSRMGSNHEILRLRSNFISTFPRFLVLSKMYSARNATELNSGERWWGFRLVKYEKDFWEDEGKRESGCLKGVRSKMSITDF